MALNEKGQEIPDRTPVAIPVRFRGARDSLQEQIRRAVREEISRGVAQAGGESFEEADDFDVDDDPEIKSPYEVDEDLPKWDEKQRRQEAVEEAERKLARRNRKNPDDDVKAFGKRLFDFFKANGAPPEGGEEPDNVGREQKVRQNL